MIFRTISRLQKKPDHVKKAFAIALTSLMMLPVLLVWLSSFSVSVSEETQTASAASPLSLLGGGLEEIYTSLKTQVFEGGGEN